MSEDLDTGSIVFFLIDIDSDNPDPKAVLDDSTVLVDVNTVEFKASGTVLVDPGWYAVDGRKVSKSPLPVMQKDDLLQGEYSLKEGETEPPKRYTEADLLAAMELAGQNIEDEEIRTLMKMQKKGLGTDATRAPILKKYRYILRCAEFVSGSGYKYDSIMDADFTTEPDWNIDEFCSYILGDASEEYLLEIIKNEKENGIDHKYTYSTYRYRDDYDDTFDDGDPLFTISFWESDAAKKFIDQHKLKEVGYEIDD